MKLCSFACLGAVLIAEDAIMDTDGDADDSAEALETIDDFKAELFNEVEALASATGAADTIFLFWGRILIDVRGVRLQPTHA